MTDNEKADLKGKLEIESNKLHQKCYKLLHISETLPLTKKNLFYKHMNRIFEISEKINYPKRVVVEGTKVKYHWLECTYHANHNLLTYVCSELTNADLEIVKFVLERTADLSYTNGSGMTAIHCAAMSNRREIITTILGQRHLSEDDKAALINRDSAHHNYSPLMTAAKYGSIGAFHELILKNADPKFVNKNGENIFHAAASNRKGPKEWTLKLIENGRIVIDGLTDEEIQNFLNTKNNDDKTPYEIAKLNKPYMIAKDEDFFKSDDQIESEREKVSKGNTVPNKDNQIPNKKRKEEKAVADSSKSDKQITKKIKNSNSSSSSTGGGGSSNADNSNSIKTSEKMKVTLFLTDPKDYNDDDDHAESTANNVIASNNRVMKRPIEDTSSTSSVRPVVTPTIEPNVNSNSNRNPNKDVDNRRNSSITSVLTPTVEPVYANDLLAYLKEYNYENDIIAFFEDRKDNYTSISFMKEIFNPLVIDGDDAYKELLVDFGKWNSNKSNDSIPLPIRAQLLRLVKFFIQ